MRFILCVVSICLAISNSVAQAYSLKPGQTAIKIEIEGRGNVMILLHTKEAPKTVEHISKLVSDGFYNAQRFHRVIVSPKPYLVQVGDPASKTGDLSNTGSGGSGSTVPYEDSGFANVAGAVGLVRTNVDDKNSGDSQFYMLLDRSSFLDGNYTVFGKIVAGMDVLKKIQRGDRVVSMTLLKG